MKRTLWIIFAMSLSANIPVSLFPYYQDHFHLDDIGITILFSIYGLFLLSSLLVSGSFGDTWGCKKVVLIGLIMALISSFLFSLTNSIWLLYLARITTGISLGIFMGAGNALLLKNTPLANMTKALTYSAMITMLGYGIGPVLSGFIFEYVTWNKVRLPFFLLFSVLLSALIILFSLPKEKIKKNYTPFLKISLGVPKSGIRLFWFFIAPSAFLMFSLNGSVIALTPTYVKEVMHSTNHLWAGLLIFLLLGGSSFFQKIPCPVSLHSRIQLGISLLVIGAWIMLLAGPEANMILLFIGIIIQSAGCGWTFQSGLQLTGGLVKKGDRSRVLSSFYIAAYLGMAFTTVGVGILSNYFGLLAALVYTTSLFTLIGFCLVLVPILLSFTQKNTQLENITNTKIK
ncbi:Predicted arabinose efflux permease, MFS family [Priestia aryabhattai B8W22]|uniref:MFS transporter n=1 Tax=Priestia aryabhattai TaxID=412384 RepID=UPI000891D87A|nr:Predicted arabinose efflux permease, MFS family [Priestia aryabhattai B8W22]